MTSIRLFGQKVRNLRARRGISQAALATALGFSATSRSYISEIEKGKKMPAAEAIVHMAEYFEVSVDYLLRDEIGIQDVQDYPGPQP